MPSKMFDILVYLHREGESNVKKIIEDLGIGRGTFYSSIGKARDLGFVFERERKGWPAYSFYNLTHRGEELVESLIPVKRIIDGTVRGIECELRKLSSRRKTNARIERELNLLERLVRLKFERGEWKDAIRYSRKSIKLGQSVSDEMRVAKGNRTLGHILQCMNRFDDAMAVLETSLEISSKIHDSRGVAESNYLLAVILERLGELDSSDSYYKDCILYCKRYKYRLLGSRALLGVGRVSAKRGSIPKSMRVMKLDVRELEKLGENQELPRAYGSIGAVAMRADIKEGLKWNKKCIHASRKQGNIRMLGYGLFNISGCYLQLELHKKANDCLDEALTIFRKLREKGMISNVYIQYGEMKRRERKWRESEESFEKGLSILEKIEEKYSLAEALLKFGKLCRDRGEARRARVMLDKSLSIFNNIKSKDKIATLEEEMKNLDH
ncbi:MAG: tetratricopeptide repeat protein [Methanobacteriota archaeon]|nr:MAG: tetratricopeptide repeat protein [Euryarchaeota archaeon]